MIRSLSMKRSFLIPALLILLPSLSATLRAAEPPASARARLEASLSARWGGTWRIYSWNAATGTPAAAYGTGAAVAGPLSSGERAAAAAREILRAYPELFGAPAEELLLRGTPHAGGKWAAHFRQVHRGLEVAGARAFLVFRDGGELIALGSTCRSVIAVDPVPSLDAARAIAIARAAFPAARAVEETGGAAELLFIPDPGGEPAGALHLAWRVRLKTMEPPGLWTTCVDAHSGRVLARINELRFLDFTGSAAGMIERPTWCEGQHEEPLPYIRVEVAGVGSTYADAAGDWSIPYGGSDARAIASSLVSPYVEVHNLAGANASYSGVAVPGTPQQILFTDANAQRDERDVFQTVNDIHTFYQTFAPEYAYVHQRISAYVSWNSYCSAYYNPGENSINFYVEGSGCSNSGRLVGVVAHEYAHGITHDLYGGAVLQTGMVEGNSDVASNLVTMESLIGRGFFSGNCVDGIRDSENSLRYPEDVIGEDEFDAGRVIAGFHWDAQEWLMDHHGPEEGRRLAGRAWHLGRVLFLPTTQPEQVLATFMADDDDGDLNNGTPHYEAFCLGAANHGFDCPGLSSGLPQSEGERGREDRPVLRCPSPYLPGQAILLRPRPCAPRIRLSVYDARGRLARRLFEGSLSPGTTRFAWDGRLPDGDAAAGGIYYLRAAAGTDAKGMVAVSTQPLLLLR